MRDLLKRLTRMVIGYGAVQWAGPFLSLIFTPIITRALTPADYGVADYLLTMVSALSTLALIALPQALLTHFNDQPETLAWQRAVVGSAYTIAATSGLIFGVLLFLFAPTLTLYLPILGPYTDLVRLIAITFVFGLTGSILTTASQAALRVRWGMVYSLASIVGTVAGNIFFIVVLRLGVTGMILTPIVTGVAVWVAGMMLARGLIGRPSPAVASILLRSGLVLLPTMMAAWVLQVSDRLFLGQYVTETQLGYYAIANRMASLVGVAMTPIYAAWQPLALAVQNQAGAMERYVAMSRYLIATVLMVGLAIGLYATEILMVLTRPAYLPAAPYVGFLAYIYVFSGFGAVFTIGAMMGKKLGAISVAVVVGAVTNIALNLLLIPRFGIWGATTATVIGYAVPQVVLFGWLARHYPIPYPIGRLMAGLGIQFILQMGGLLVPAIFFPIRILIKLGILAILPLSFVILNIITQNEIVTASRFTRKQLRLGWTKISYLGRDS
ncbi:MAG: oligosaccharide flippase family protein [Caldilineaceae bacterium]|nr:oligosaccharide flippase family protein [Caldilineaceae bacterium]